MGKKVVITATMAMAAGMAHAATISWRAEQIGLTGNLSQISNTNSGTANVEAFSFGADGTATQERNGVNFVEVADSEASSGGKFSWTANANSTAFWNDSNPSGNTSYYHQLRGAWYGYNTDQVNNTITLNDLTIGQKYEIQLFVHDGRSVVGHREVKLTGDATAASWSAISAADASTVIANGWIGSDATIQGPGAVITGTFVADATTQGFYMLLWQNNSSNVQGQINAYQLREVPVLSIDGVPIGWIIEHFGSTNGFSGAGDPDLDGMTNFEEYLADTDPNDSGSILLLGDLAESAGTAAVTWENGGTNANLLLDYRTDLVSGYWTNIYALYPPVQPTNAYAHGTADESGFYRLRSERPLEIMDRSANLMNAPLVAPWKAVPTIPEYGGMWTAVGDLDGDGQVEVVTARNTYWWTGPVASGGSDISYVCSIIAQELDGTELWHWGNPNVGRRIMTHDVACQIYDWDGDGNNEVVVIGKTSGDQTPTGTSLHIFDGATGSILGTFPVPDYATDCVVPADLTNTGRPVDFILKDRYFNVFGMRSDGTLLWQAPTKALIPGPAYGHHPYPVDITGDGKDEVFAGFYMLNSNGTERWQLSGSNHTNDWYIHADTVVMVRSGATPADWLFAITYHSGLGIGVVDGNGVVQKERLDIGHYQSAQGGAIFPGHKLPHLIADLDGRPYGDACIEVLDGDLNPLGRVLLDYGRNHALVDWDGDGYDDIVNANNGAIYNYKGEKLASLDLAGDHGRVLQVGDFTGDQIKDILIVGAAMNHVYIFKNENGTATPGTPLGTDKNHTLY